MIVAAEVTAVGKWETSFVFHLFHSLSGLCVTPLRIEARIAGAILPTTKPEFPNKETGSHRLESMLIRMIAVIGCLPGVKVRHTVVARH